MNKKDYLKDLREIQGMANSIRTIKESMSFGDNYDDDEMMGGEPQAQAQPQAPVPPQQGEGTAPMQGGEQQSPEDQEMANELADENSPINMIREIALKGMVRLCKTPEDPQYEVLKKVFTMIDKANDKKAEQNNA